MNQDLGLRILGQIMEWTDDRAREEFDWLRLIARLKYDGYRDFQAGMRFVESLVTWLQQFQLHERTTAYAFVRECLVYVGPSETQRLVEQFYPQTVRDRLDRIAATEYSVPLHRVLVDPRTAPARARLRRQTLFMGLSDGARLDNVRHENSGLLGNEQFVQGTQVDEEKWRDLISNLREDLNDPEARFRIVYLVDDFAGTGTSFLRFDKKAQRWKGKLIRFRDSVTAAHRSLETDKLFDNDWELCVHYYIASSAAASAIQERIRKAADDGTFSGDWARKTHATFGMTLPESLPIDKEPERHHDFIELTKKYYDPALRTKHTDVGGASHLGLGYGAGALPLILEHNTPNNSVALLWADTIGSTQGDTAAPAMRPLFRRRQRHE